MSPWKKNIAVKLPPFWSWSETCRNFGHVTLTCWVFSRAFWAGIFVQKFVESVSKNILLDIDEFQAEEASSLLILKAIFLSKCHTNILSWPIHELHISRGNIFFPVDFLFDQWNQLRLMFFLLPFYTFHLESYLCHTNTGFLCMATGKLSSLTGTMQIHEVTIRSDLSMKKKNLPADPFFKAVEIKESRKRSSVVPSLDGNLE